jgi:hypothetical protein
MSELRLERAVILGNVALAAILFAGRPARAQGTPNTTGEPASSPGPSAPVNDTATGAPKAETPPPPASGAAGNPAASALAKMGAEPEGAFVPTFKFKVYSDLNFVLAEGEDPAFKLGGVDFFLTGDISEDFSALSENVLEILGDEGTVFDLERIYLEWHPKRWFKLRFGRDHLMLGRYMQTYHHALFFQLAAARPYMLAFEDEGGLLPAHQIGIEALGDIPLGGELDLHYAVGVGNGRGQFSDDVLSTRDRNAFKSLVAQLSLSPHFLPGFEIGVSGYLDRIPPGFTDAMGRVLLAEAVDEQIGGAHIVYASYPFEAQAEGYYLVHRGRDTGLSTHLIGGFGQVGVSFEQLTPYARIEGADRSVGDTFFNISGAANRLLELRTGLRYGLSDQAVLKLEYRRDFENRINGAVLQAAFGM